jgi:hypothetical protein
MKIEKHVNKESFAYKSGQFLGGIIFGCIGISVIAITGKFIVWLFNF